MNVDVKKMIRQLDKAASKAEEILELEIGDGFDLDVARTKVSAGHVVCRSVGWNIRARMCSHNLQG